MDFRALRAANHRRPSASSVKNAVNGSVLLDFGEPRAAAFPSGRPCCCAFFLAADAGVMPSKYIQYACQEEGRGGRGRPCAHAPAPRGPAWGAGPPATLEIKAAGMGGVGDQRAVSMMLSNPPRATTT